ncbi:MAG: FAD-dependent oxidoreductase, partial [Chloroflexota bacterium]|nr:FAD-dependent oxidoreductase [Chloroflexota bacterium]
MAKEIVFESEADMPLMPMSLGTTLINKTGSWRYIRPVYINKTPPCNHACPAGEDIVTQIELMAEGRFEEAWQRLMEENPLPGVCGRICPHFCERECNHKEMGGAIVIHLLEQFLAHYAASHDLSVPRPETHRQERVAVVGAGACGLSAAYFLARSGYRVTLFEARNELGGRMRLVKESRLPKEVLEREIAQITDLGIEVRTGMLLGANLA